MGRRYINDMVPYEEIITYHVYENNIKVGEYTRDKEGAKKHAKRLKGKVEIKKTRVQIPRK